MQCYRHSISTYKLFHKHYSHPTSLFTSRFIAATSISIYQPFHCSHFHLYNLSAVSLQPLPSLLTSRFIAATSISIYQSLHCSHFHLLTSRFIAATSISIYQPFHCSHFHLYNLPVVSLQPLPSLFLPVVSLQPLPSLFASRAERIVARLSASRHQRAR